MLIKKLLATLILTLIISNTINGQQTSYNDRLTLNIENNTFWWTDIVNYSYKMPFEKAISGRDFTNSNYRNQVQPLMLSSEVK